jgi:DNA-binding IclR family transcriptional regulator
MPRDGHIGSALGKAVLVLETVIDRPGPVSFGALAMWHGLPKQTVHRIVHQLVNEGLLYKSKSGEGYTVASRLSRLGRRILERAIDEAPVRAILTGLVETIGATCNIGILDNNDVLYLERVECAWPLRMQLQPGSRVPPHCTGIGKMLLASLESRTRKRLVSKLPLKRYTEKTITDRGDLLAELKRIRHQDFALNNQENTTGMMGLAVPIRDREARVVAGLAVHTPVARLTTDAALKQVETLHAAALQIGVALTTENEEYYDECRTRAGDDDWHIGSRADRRPGRRRDQGREPGECG